MIFLLLVMRLMKYKLQWFKFFESQLPLNLITPEGFTVI